MARETGLEAGGAVHGKRSCFKASSGDHSRFPTTANHPAVYCLPACTQVFYFFYIHNILYMLHGETRPNASANRSLGKQPGLARARSALRKDETPHESTWQERRGMRVWPSLYPGTCETRSSRGPTESASRAVPCGTGRANGSTSLCDGPGSTARIVWRPQVMDLCWTLRGWSRNRTTFLLCAAFRPGHMTGEMGAPFPPLRYVRYS
jgi:hypothetical protein